MYTKTSQKLEEKFSYQLYMYWHLWVLLSLHPLIAHQEFLQQQQTQSTNQKKMVTFQQIASTNFIA